MILNSHNRQILYSSLDFILLKGERVGKGSVSAHCFHTNDILIRLFKIIQHKKNACILRLHRFISIKNT